MINSFNEETILNEKIYEISSNKSNIVSIKIKNSSSILIVNAFVENNLIKYNFSNNFTLDSLKENNKYLQLYESIQEIYEDLILLMDKKKTIIIEEESYLIIKIPLESIKFKEIKLTLKKCEKNEKEKYQELMLIMTELKKEIKDMKLNNKEQIKKLLDENKELKEEIKKLNRRIKKLEDFEIKIQKKEGNNEKYIKNLDSLIISQNENYNSTLKNWINPDLKIKAKLLFRASRDGDSYSTFHKLCDYQKPTLELVKFKNGNILGSYTTLDWESGEDKWKSDSNMFVFSLTQNKKAKKKNLIGI